MAASRTRTRSRKRARVHPWTDAPPLSWDRWQRVFNFGRSTWRPSWVVRPTRADEVAALLAWAGEHGWRVALRGAGRSYGDASLGDGHILLDLTRMNRILDWDPETGLLTVEPGVTVEQIWKHCLEDGWWMPVVPGTMFPTMGGMLAVNVHGKNNWKAGTLGEHVRSLTLLTPAGETLVLTPEDTPEAFHAVIGGLGVLGVITSVTLQMKRVYSGDLEVHAWAVSNLEQALQDLDEAKDRFDYVVAWLDGLAGGRALGRGQIHVARYLAPGEDPQPACTLRVEHQVLPETLFGLFPKSVLWRFMRLGMHRPGMRLVNLGKYLVARTLSHHKVYRQSLVAFNFLLDYIPHWERSYGSGGMMQFQLFVPKEQAYDVFREVLRISRREVPTYLAVLKRHRPDNFLLSHGVDGYSLALDFPVRPHQMHRLAAMLDTFHHLVLQAGGRFYFAKDASVTPQVALAFLGEETVRRFFALKDRYDPQDVLQTALYRRVFLPLREMLSLPRPSPGGNGAPRR